MVPRAIFFFFKLSSRRRGWASAYCLVSLLVCEADIIISTVCRKRVRSREIKSLAQVHTVGKRQSGDIPCASSWLSQESYTSNSDSKTSALFHILSLNPLPTGKATFSEAREWALLDLLLNIYPMAPSILAMMAWFLSLEYTSWCLSQDLCSSSCLQSVPQISPWLPASHHSGLTLCHCFRETFPKHSRESSPPLPPTNIHSHSHFIFFSISLNLC